MNDLKNSSTLSKPGISTDMKIHSYVNILAALLIAYYFMHKEGHIKF